MAAERRCDTEELGAPAPALSPAEREVATLAAAGWTNAAISVHRGTSDRTVANQMASIFRKLGVSSRQELAAHIVSTTSRPRP
jgi:DNA-binding NarL/FixJ family response regulator